MSLQTLFTEAAIIGNIRLKVPEDDETKVYHLKEFVIKANPLVLFYPHNNGDFAPLARRKELPVFARDFLRYDDPDSKNKSLLWINMNFNPYDPDGHDNSWNIVHKIMTANEFLGIENQKEYADAKFRGEDLKSFRCYYFLAKCKSDPETDKTIVFFTFGDHRNVISDIFIKYGIGFYVPPDLGRVY